MKGIFEMYITQMDNAPVEDFYRVTLCLVPEEAIEDKDPSNITYMDIAKGDLEGCMRVAEAISVAASQATIIKCKQDH